MEPVLYKRGVRAGHIHGSRSVSENIITLVPTARQFVKQAYEYGAKGKFRKEAKQWRLAETEAKAHNRHLMASVFGDRAKHAEKDAEAKSILRAFRK